MLAPGNSLDGYRVIRKIGSGGFGEVWICKSEAVGDFRALKFIPGANSERLEKEFDALCRYRTAATQLRSPSLMPIEHVNRLGDGLFYVMPLADGYGAEDPCDSAWHPLTLNALIERQRHESSWFTLEEIQALIAPVLEALQLLSDAGLVHRDVKPDNILLLQGNPCLADIGLLGADSDNITRRGTPGYSAPSWYLESGGHPDIYGVATTLYSLTTGNPPDKMGRAAFQWPPQGEAALTPKQRQEILFLHKIRRRAVDDRPSERFADFTSFGRALLKDAATSAPARKTRVMAMAASAVLAGSLALFWFAFGNHAWRSGSPRNSGGAGAQPSERELAGQTEELSAAMGKIAAELQAFELKSPALEQSGLEADAKALADVEKQLSKTLDSYSHRVLKQEYGTWSLGQQIRALIPICVRIGNKYTSHSTALSISGISITSDAPKPSTEKIRLSQEITNTAFEMMKKCQNFGFDAKSRDKSPSSSNTEGKQFSLSLTCPEITETPLISTGRGS